MKKENEKKIENIEEEKNKLLNLLDREDVEEPTRKLENPAKKFEDFEKAFTR